MVAACAIRMELGKRAIGRREVASFLLFPLLNACNSRGNLPSRWNATVLARLHNGSVECFDLEGLSMHAIPHPWCKDAVAYAIGWDYLAATRANIKMDGAPHQIGVFNLQGDPRMMTECARAPLLVAPSADGAGCAFAFGTPSSSLELFLQFRDQPAVRLMTVAPIRDLQRARLTFSFDGRYLFYCNGSSLVTLDIARKLVLEEWEGVNVAPSPSGRVAFQRGAGLFVREANGALRELHRQREVLGIHGWIPDDSGSLLISERTFPFALKGGYRRWSVIDIEDQTETVIGFGHSHGSFSLARRPY